MLGNEKIIKLTILRLSRILSWKRKINPYPEQIDEQLMY